MTNKELQEYLRQWPDDLPIKFLPDNSVPQLSVDNKAVHSVEDFTEEKIMWTTDKAWVNSDAEPDTWDTEDGKIVYDGNPYLLFNPIIL